jgi:hypothetical protein
VAYQASSWASAESAVKDASSSPASAAAIASAAAATSGTASRPSTWPEAMALSGISARTVTAAGSSS